jgi:hypothetical protein
MTDPYAHQRAELRRREQGPACALCRETNLTPADYQPDIHLDDDPPESIRFAFCRKRGINVVADMGRGCREFERRPDARPPKSLRHWAERAGFHMPKGYHRSWRRRGYFWARSTKSTHIADCMSPKRFIRVLPHLDRMDICDGFFDRWANSMGASVRMPLTEAEFQAAIKTLLSKSRKRVRATHPDSA